MKRKALLVLLGNQLFPIEAIRKTQVDKIFMSEDYDLCTYEKHHKLKILMFLVAMREKRDELTATNFKLEYQSLEETPSPKSYEQKLNNCISNNNITEVQMFEIEDKDDWFMVNVLYQNIDAFFESFSIKCSVISFNIALALIGSNQMCGSNSPWWCPSCPS